MMKYFFNAMAVVAVTAFLSADAIAQQDNEIAKIDGNREIIIMKKGDKDTKLTVEIKDGEVSINGKPLAEFKDDNVVVSKRRAPVTMGFGPARSPFRGGTMNFNDSAFARINGLFTNRALLGVVTEKADDGVKVASVAKGSAAEKAGLKENDVITKVDNTEITSPEDLTKAIGKFKPEEKTIIFYKRDKKDMKANIVLGKRSDATTLYRGDGNEIFRNFNFNYNMPRPGLEGFGMIRGGGPRLGIKAQDTEEGKGVKVLDVDDASNAQKAGIKEGDIIIEFDNKVVNSATELADAAREAKDKSSIKVKLNRNGKAQEIEIKVPRKLKTANL
jgi:serine protease Do